MRANLPMLSHQVLVRGVEREVLTFRTPVRHVFVRHDGELGWHLFADAAGFSRLAELATVVATSPDRIAFLPRRDRIAEAWADGWAPWDLVFVNHTVQLPASAWIDQRRRLGPGRPVTRRASPPPVQDDRFRQDHRTWSRNPVDLRGNGQTLVVSASPPAFQALAALFDSLSRAPSGHHFHFQDWVRLREYPKARLKGCHDSDLICFFCTDWRDEP